MKKLLFCMAMGILLLGCVNVVYAAESHIVKSEKAAGGQGVFGNPNAKGVTSSIPSPRDKSWKKGVTAFGNYDYEQAISCFIESPSPLAKYYLAKLYFGDVPMNNLGGASLPEINQQKAIEILNTIINYKESQELKNKYAALMNSPEALSKFYYEQGNYEEAEKAIERIQGKEAEEVKQRYPSYSQPFKNSTLTTSTPSEEAVASVQPELKLPPKATTSNDTIKSQQEPTFVEEDGRGHDSFSEAACFVDGHQQQISDENDEMITVDSKSIPSHAKKRQPEFVSEETPLPECPPQKGSTLVSIKPAIVWDWPALPGYDYKPVARIKENTKMVLLNDIENKWYYKVELSDGKEGAPLAIGYICSYLVEGIDKKTTESVKKTETIEEVSEYINYLVDRHEEKKEIAKPVKKKKKQVAKKSSASKQSVKSVKAQDVKPQEQQGVVFVDEAPVKSQPATATEHKPVSEVSEHKPAPAGK